MPNIIDQIGNNSTVSATANLMNIAEFSMLLKDLSNTQLLLEITKQFDKQNKSQLLTIQKYCEKMIFQNEKIIKQNNKIISLLEGKNE